MGNAGGIEKNFGCFDNESPLFRHLNVLNCLPAAHKGLEAVK
jgi:hypothetical protein